MYFEFEVCNFWCCYFLVQQWIQYLLWKFTFIEFKISPLHLTLKYLRLFLGLSSCLNLLVGWQVCGVVSLDFLHPDNAVHKTIRLIGCRFELHGDKLGDCLQICNVNIKIPGMLLRTCNFSTSPTNYLHTFTQES